MPFIYASTGSPGRIGEVHLDVIEEIRLVSTYDRTNTAIERGAPITNHRQRVPYQLQVTVLLSDVEPSFQAGTIGLWEPLPGHARIIRDKLRAIQEQGRLVTFFDGMEFWRTPSGKRVWIIDEISEGKTVEFNHGVSTQAWRGIITLGEVPRFGTVFTVVSPEVADVVQDSVDGIVDAGQQSTEAVPADVAAAIPG